ncbi:fimbria/pilus periplasmic chaperone [Enterobacter hormaechei]|uniref:fimbria/pilus periplasmic chaperone n=1 Tax=Enterobacter hormaechei TaxID=158836 RepID=UPI001256894E|nr:fimbria/pilus periplasmic chaperone [Enterobacter hormaechei]VAL10001.1 Pili assembly chaperone [Enterobacter hormaechei]
MAIIKWIVFFFSMHIFTVYANGGTYLDTTRVIYNENNGAKAVKVTNTSADYPYLVRGWVSSADTDGADDKWVVTPPVYRLNENSAIQLKITNIDSSKLPKDRESLFFLNVLTIPGDSSKNKKT